LANSRQFRSLTLGLSVGTATGALAVAIVFMLTVVASPAAQAQTFQIIHAFTGKQDGGWPYAGVTIDKSGNLYGTTYAFGANDKGAVFKMSKLKGGNWALHPIYIFTGGSDGGWPAARVIFGPNGTLYGTTQIGGNGYGTVFQLTPPPTACTTALCPWRETVLYAFKGAPDCGNRATSSFGELIFDQAGNIYGTTYNGGVHDEGCVYKLTPSGSGGYTESVIHSFGGGSDGYFPFTGVILDSTGNLYGTTSTGGQSVYYGTVYQLVPSMGGYTENILYSFKGGSDGEFPFGGLIFDRSGNLYGSTEDGGPGGGGTAFELTPVGNGKWSYTALYSFSGASYDGPYASFVMDGAGNLYGTTWGSGANRLGNVFKLTPTSQPPWTYTSLHDFTGYDGQYLISNVTFDASGNLYGTAFQGDNGNCDTGCGVVWEITP